MTTARRIDDEVLAALSASTVDGSMLRLAGQLDRPTYVAVAKVIEAAGGKWNRKAQAHLFDRSAEDVIDQIILSGEVTFPADFGYFPTPRDLAEALVAMAEVTEGTTMLEPSAGRGAIADAALACGATVDCIELLPDNVSVLLRAKRYRSVRHADFLTIAATDVYDDIVMNPPFAREADIRHVDHALDFLAPGGKLVSVMSAGARFRQTNRAVAFRGRIARLGGYFEDLPDGSFTESGTDVRTCMVVV